jgi:hypothetical protein
MGSHIASVRVLPLITIIVGREADPNEGGLMAPFSRNAQQFTLTAGAYIGGLDLTWGLLAEGRTCSLSVAITDHLFPDGSLGKLWLQRMESVVGINSWITSDAFPAVFLPAGIYYLVVDFDSGPSPCWTPDGPNVAWQDNLSGANIGIVGPSFRWQGPGPGSYWAIDTVHTFIFDLFGPLLMGPPIGGGLGQIVRFVVGPVTPRPGDPVEAQAGFVNVATGALQLSPVTLIPGRVQTLDFDLSKFVSRPGERVELSAVLAQVPGTVSPPVQVTTSVQVLDAETGFGTVMAQAPLPGMSSPGLGPQILAHGQTMRIDVVSSSQDACVGQVSFNDSKGNALIPPTPINLRPGTGTFIDLKAHALGLERGQQIEVQPVLTPSGPVGAVALKSVCHVSAQVFDTASGKTLTHQSTLVALPAV